MQYSREIILIYRFGVLKIAIKLKLMPQSHAIGGFILKLRGMHGK
jgi:hypothetical protein